MQNYRTQDELKAEHKASLLESLGTHVLQALWVKLWAILTREGDVCFKGFLEN